MVIKNVSVLKTIVIVALLSSASITMPQETLSRNVMSWGQLAARFVSGGIAVAGIGAYYQGIIKPYIIDLAKEKGLKYAIKFNYDFVKENPYLAFRYAWPLFFAGSSLLIGYDYVKFSTAALAFIATDTLFYGINYFIKSNEYKERSFEENLAQLSASIAAFVGDFATWPKEEQDKVEIFSRGYVMHGAPAASDKYDGNIGYWLDCRLNQRQIMPFLAVLDYLKKTKK